MKRGDKINIYEDPLTKTKLEGKATLKEKVMTLNDDLELWWVSFKGEYDIALRKVATY